MAARQEADEGFGAALDRVSARFAHPFAAFDIKVDLGGAQRLEGDDRIDDADPRPAVAIDDADPRPDMMPPRWPSYAWMKTVGWRAARKLKLGS